MSSRRKTAIAVGILFIVATAASIVGSAVLGSLLDGPDYLDTLSSHGGRVVVAALIFMIAATAAFGTACLLFPILRSHAEGLAAGYVGLRAFENVFYVLGAVGLLIMLSLSRSTAVGGADTGALALGRVW